MVDHETLRLMRLARRLSQEALGQKIGVSQERISLLERGLKPTPEEEKKLLEVLAEGGAQ